MARLQATAAEHSMSITQHPDTLRLTATRTGPGFPRRLTTTATANTPDAWNTAAHLLHQHIHDTATPNTLGP